jgi:Sulfotransferase family
MAATSTGGAETPAVSPAAGEGRLKVIYVMGAGHSGSTILGVTLGNCAGLFYAGEVDEWLVCSGVPPLGGPERTRFWNGVRAEVQGAEELFGGEVNHCVERSSAIFRLDRWPARLRMRRRYQRVTQDLYRAISRVAGAGYVIDSSHFPLRARELKRLANIELYLLFLVRDPQRVVASELRGIKRHEVVERRLRTVTTNANLWLTSLLAVRVFLGHPREQRIFVRHEDFLASPETVLQQILDRFAPSTEVPDLTSLTTGYPLLGNKIIRQETLALERGDSSPSRASRITALAQLPWRPVFARLRPAATAAKG